MLRKWQLFTAFKCAFKVREIHHIYQSAFIHLHILPVIRTEIYQFRWQTGRRQNQNLEDVRVNISLYRCSLHARELLRCHLTKGQLRATDWKWKRSNGFGWLASVMWSGFTRNVKIDETFPLGWVETLWRLRLLKSCWDYEKKKNSKHLKFMTPQTWEKADTLGK